MRRFTITSLLLLLSFATSLFSQTGRSEAIHSDSLFIVEYIDITGTIKTRPNVIRRNLDFSVGQAIDARTLERNYLRLDATNFFKSISISTRPGSQPGRIGVLIEVKERWWPTLHFEGGHSELDGWFFSPIAIRGDNMFGHGNYNTIKLLYGHRLSALDFEFYDPSFIVKNTFLKINLTAQSRGFIHYLDGEKYRENVAGGKIRLSWGGTKGLFSHFQVHLKSNTVEADSFAVLAKDKDEKRLLPEEMLRETGKIQRHSIAFILDADTRDNPYYPCKGFWGAIWAEFSRGNTTHNSNFKRFIFDARVFLRVRKMDVFAVRLKAGRTSASTPFYERFYVGGPNSLRGYPDRYLTPVGYGTRLGLANFEYRFPLTREGFPNHTWTGVFFLDIGGIWKPNEQVYWDSLYSGAGFGIRVKLPIVGLVRLDWAFPLQVRDYQLQLSLSHMF